MITLIKNAVAGTMEWLIKNLKCYVQFISVNSVSE